MYMVGRTGLMMVVVIGVLGFAGVYVSSDVMEDAFAHIIDALSVTGGNSLRDASSSALELNEPLGVQVAIVSGNPVAFVAGSADDGIQAIYLGVANQLLPAGTIQDDGDSLLAGPTDLDLWVYDNRLYAAVTSYNEDGIQTINVTDTGNMEALSNKADHSSRFLDSPRSVDVYEDDGKWYAAVAVEQDHAVQVFNVTDPADISTNDGIEDNQDMLLEYPYGISVYKSGGHIYAAVTSTIEGGVQILNLTDPDNITAAGKIADTDTLILGRTYGIEVVGQTAYVASFDDGGVQVLNVSDPTNIGVLGGIRDSDGSGATTSLLRGATDVKAFSWDGSDYLAVTSTAENGVQILNISDGALYSLNKDDMLVGGLPDGGALRLDSPYGVAYYTVANEPYLIVTSSDESAVQIVKIADGPTSINTPPVVDAGANQTVNAGDTVTIGSDAVVTDADSGDHASLTYRWDVPPLPGNNPLASIMLTNPDTLITTFIPPFIINEDYLRFKLVATDHHGGFGTDHITMTFRGNAPPNVDAGPEQLVVSGSLVHLAGTATDPEGHTPLSPLWSDSTDRPGHTQVTFGNPALLFTTFTAPTVTVNTTLTLQLTVADRHGTSASDTVNITVWDPPSRPPVVDAGQAQRVDDGTSVTLTGTATDPEGETMTFSWVCRSTYHTFTAGTDQSVTFTAPSLSRGDVTYTCTFTATDPHSVSSSDTVRLVVRDIPDDGPVLLVLGDRDMTVSTSSSWVDPGARCVTVRGGNTLPVTVTGSVDLTTAGKYVLSYTCSHAGHIITHDRNIRVNNVAFDSNPKVTVIYHRGAIGSNALNADYSSDAACRDLEDGDISNKITTTGKSFPATDKNPPYAEITYRCTDSAGNTSIIIQRVGIIDGNSPPTISLIGKTMYLSVGDTWRDPGATCTDAEDGTWTIYASRNTVNTTTAGHYLAIYECIDSDGARQTNGGVRHVHVSGGDLPPVLNVSPTEIAINAGETLPTITATCTDREDGNLTDFIEVVDNEVETANEGIYYIRYSCTDSAENFVLVYVKITVTKP